MNDDITKTRRRWTRWVEPLALLAYGVVLFAYRPLDPFEWDEVLFQRALDHYDVATHSPHPPGYPLYVGVAKAVRSVVGNPQLALQLVAIVSALAAVTLTWLLARRLGAGRWTAGLAAAALAVFPGFIFNGNIGMSDVPGVAAAVGMALLFVLAWDRPAFLPVAALAAGALSGIRPANLIVAMPMAAVAIAAAWRRRSWRWLVLAPLAFVVGAAAVWAPAILTTGTARFLGAVKQQAAYIDRAWVRMRLPGADLHDIARFWGARWLGLTPMAALFWLLVVAGALAWWRDGRRRLVAVTALAAGVFMVFVVFELEYDLSMRYALPAAPFIAILAAGVTTLPWRRVRGIASAALVAWIAGTAIWVAPALPVRLEPAPVWQALKYVAATFDPGKTRVLIDGVMGPHVKYMLEPDGFRFDAFKSSNLAMEAREAGPDTILITPRPLPETDVLFHTAWGSPLVMRLARNRYGECTVARPHPAPPVPIMPPEAKATGEPWVLKGTETIRLPESAAPQVVILESRKEPITVEQPGLPPVTVAPGRPFSALVVPGLAGQVRVSAPAGGQAEMAPIRFTALEPNSVIPGPASALVVPQVAHISGYFGSSWRTDLLLFNPNTFAVKATVMFLPTHRANPEVAAVEVALAPGASANLHDVIGLPALASQGQFGALIVRGETTGGTPSAAAVVASSRTYNTRADAATGNPGERLPAVSIVDGLCRGGKAAFRSVTRGAQRRVNLGLVALAASPVQVRVVQRDRAGAPRGETIWKLPAFGHLQRKLEDEPAEGSVELEVVSGPPDARVFAYVSEIDNVSGRPTHLLPEVTQPGGANAVLAPLPRQLPPATPAPK